MFAVFNTSFEGRKESFTRSLNVHCRVHVIFVRSKPFSTCLDLNNRGLFCMSMCDR